MLDLGIAPYLPVQALQVRMRAAVAGGALPGVILLLEHPPVITLGKRASDQDLLDMRLIRARGLEIARSERGGQTTLHAPGQLITYPIIPIPHRDLRAYVDSLEQTLTLLLAAHGVHACRRAGHPGLYVDEKKIASVGLRCQHWVASHGTSLNVNIDLSLFDLITACGEPGLRPTSLEEINGSAPSMDAMKQGYLRAFTTVFGFESTTPLAVSYDNVEESLGIVPAGVTG